MLPGWSLVDLHAPLTFGLRMAPAPTITDVLILGGGHAGLSAALTLYRALHTCVIFDTCQPRNQWDTPVHIVPTWDYQSPEEKRKACRTELLRSGLIRFVDFGVEEISNTDDGLFRVVDGQKNEWLGRKILLAIGCTNVFPSLEGYEENFARGIFPCMLQFGYEQRGVFSAGLLAIDTLASVPHAAILAQDAYKFTDTLTIYTSSNPKLASELKDRLGPDGMIIDDRLIVRLIAGPGKAEVTLEFQDGERKTEGFLVHRPGTKVAERLIAQLGVKTTAFGDVETSPPFQQTSVPGVFAAGDCASPKWVTSTAVR